MTYRAVSIEGLPHVEAAPQPAPKTCRIRQFCGGCEMSDRQRDELHLEWLRLADAGVPQREIALGAASGGRWCP